VEGAEDVAVGFTVVLHIVGVEIETVPSP
jgi:hypothetical protein